MKQFLISIFILMLSGCSNMCLQKIDWLGDKYALIEFSSAERDIGYCKDECCNVSIPLAPMTVTNYAFDNDWIIAKSTNRSGNESYFIIRKIEVDQINIDSLYQEIIDQKFGPLSNNDFMKMKKEMRIDLLLKPID